MKSRSPFALEIDRVADEFEAAWKTGARPDPGDYLMRVPQAARASLLAELVRVDVEYRRMAGEMVTEQECLRKYRMLSANVPGLGPIDIEGNTLAQSISIDQYELVRELGKGGMGVVWLARDTLLEREVAIKLLKPGLVDQSSQRLMREAKSAARLSHPNVISIYHVLEQGEQICIVMELLGRSLSDDLRETGTLPWPEATRAIRDAADGLAAAHAAELVHRDIKPSNLLRTARGDVKVADFGLVDSPDATQLTTSGALLGTPGYMAPEQCRGDKADTRSDVYALGCTYYHLLTGRPPFEAADRREVMAQHANTPFPDPRLIVPNLPENVCEVIATACRKDPRLRYATAAQMLVDVEAILAPSVPQTPPAAPAGGRVRIFISSPGDVAEERVLANNLVRRISDEYANRLWVEPVFWEHEPLLAHDTFQNQIPRPSESEIVVCILWSRLGTRLPANITRPDGSLYKSGTEYEFENAVEGRKAKGYPDLLVYRKTAKPLVDIEDKDAVLRRLDQKEALDGFVQKWFFNASDGTLKAAFHTFENTADFEKVLEHHLRRLIQRRIPTEGNGQPSVPIKPSWTKGSPFRGLNVFEVQHAPVFFGRTKAIGEVLNALRKNAGDSVDCRAFVLILGPSGGGKSSVARAGVLPMLTQPGVIEGVGLWRRAIMRPSDSSGNLFLSLAHALLNIDALPELSSDGTTAERLAADLRGNPRGVALLIKGGLSQAAAECTVQMKLASQPDARLALLVDQLEELFTSDGISAEDRIGFIDAISALARSGRVFVIATLRSDFYDRCGDVPELVELKKGTGQYDLLPPTASEIGQMIRQPALAAGIQFEEDVHTGVRLDDVLRDAAAEHPESLPLLGFALEQLFEQRDEKRGLLLLKAYEAMGGVEGALSNQAESSFNGADAAAKESFSRVFRKLVTLSVDDNHPAVRLAASRQEIDKDPGSRDLVDKLIADRLLVADVNAVRLAHEAILKSWPRLSAWIDSEKENLKGHAEVSADAKRWQEQARNPDYLYTGGLPLDRARKILEFGFLSTDEQDFVVASLRKAAEAEFENSLVTGDRMTTVSARLRTDYPDLHAQVLTAAVTSGNAAVRGNAASLLGNEPLGPLTHSLVDLILKDPKDPVRRAAAASLIQLDQGQYFDDIAKRLDGEGNAEAIRAMANIRIAADAIADPTSFDLSFRALKPTLRSRITARSRILRLRRGWPTLLIVLFPAVLLSSLFAAIFKSMAGTLNYAFCQATASTASGAFHAVVACCFWGGFITFSLALHRLVFRTERGNKSMLQPWGALLAGAIGGATSSLLLLMVMTLVCEVSGTIKMGWTNADWHSQWDVFWNDILWRTRTFWPYMVMGVGLGLGMAAMSNALWASKRWHSFIGGQAMISGQALIPMVKTLARFLTSFLWPILVCMILADLISFYIVRTAPSTTQMPAWMSSWHAGLLGGISHDPAKVREWKMSAWGQGLGILFDSATQAIGGFCCIVGMVLGLIVVRYGIQIEAQKS